MNVFLAAGLLCLGGLTAAPAFAQDIYLTPSRDTALQEKAEAGSRSLGMLKPGWLLHATGRQGTSKAAWYEIFEINKGDGYAYAYRLYNLPGTKPFASARDMNVLPAQAPLIHPGEDAYTPEGDSLGANLKALNWYTEACRHDLGKALQVRNPLGFIGSERQRFYIHFSSIHKDPQNPGNYQVTGKTRVKENVCDFTGTLSLKKAGMFEKDGQDVEFANEKQGFVSLDVELRENSSQRGTGVIKGILTCFILLNKQEKVDYDDLAEQADGYINRYLVGSWTSYKTGKTKVCNFGDDRVPTTGLPKGLGLDQGAGEFIPVDEIRTRGWQNYGKEEEKEWWH